MSTAYEIRCGSVIHREGDRWPEGDLRRYHVPALWAIIENRSTIVAVAVIGLEITLEGAYGESLAEFLERHAGCDLAVFDEYGRMADPPSGG